MRLFRRQYARAGAGDYASLRRHFGHNLPLKEIRALPLPIDGENHRATHSSVTRQGKSPDSTKRLRRCSSSSLRRSRSIRPSSLERRRNTRVTLPMMPLSWSSASTAGMLALLDAEMRRSDRDSLVTRGNSPEDFAVRAILPLSTSSTLGSMSSVSLLSSKGSSTSISKECRHSGKC